MNDINDGYCFCGRELPPRVCLLWCNECIDEWNATGPRGQREDMKKFIARKTGTFGERP